MNMILTRSSHFGLIVVDLFLVLTPPTSLVNHRVEEERKTMIKSFYFGRKAKSRSKFLVIEVMNETEFLENESFPFFPDISNPFHDNPHELLGIKGVVCELSMGPERRMMSIIFREDKRSLLPCQVLDSSQSGKVGITVFVLTVEELNQDTIVPFDLQPQV